MTASAPLVRMRQVLKAASFPELRRRIGAGALVLVFLGGCERAPVRPESELRNELDRVYPEGWRFSTLHPFHHSELRPGESPRWIAGDFDGDGRADFAAEVVVFRPGHTLAVDSAQLLVALLRRDRGFEHHVLSTGGGPNEGIYLSLLRRGDTVADYEGRTSEALARDAVHQVFARQASVAYIYDNGGWREIATGD